jgi:hypothetical protein
VRSVGVLVVVELVVVVSPLWLVVVPPELPLSELLAVVVWLPSLVEVEVVVAVVAGVVSPSPELEGPSAEVSVRQLGTTLRRPPAGGADDPRGRDGRRSGADAR